MTSSRLLSAAPDGLAPGLRVLGKGRKQRIVPLGSYARAALEAYLVRARPGLAARGPGTPALFLNARGGRLSRQSAWSILQTVAERAGITVDVSPHTLRHSFATHLLDGGADVRVVQELLGHASVTTTQIYTLVTVDHLREVYLSSHPARVLAGGERGRSVRLPKDHAGGSVAAGSGSDERTGDPMEESLFAVPTPVPARGPDGAATEALGPTGRPWPDLPTPPPSTTTARR